MSEFYSYTSHIHMPGFYCFIPTPVTFKFSYNKFSYRVTYIRQLKIPFLICLFISSIHIVSFSFPTEWSITSSTCVSYIYSLSLMYGSQITHYHAFYEFLNISNAKVYTISAFSWCKTFTCSYKCNNTQWFFRGRYWHPTLPIFSTKCFIQTSLQMEMIQVRINSCMHSDNLGDAFYLTNIPNSNVDPKLVLKKLIISKVK